MSQDLMIQHAVPGLQDGSNNSSTNTATSPVRRDPSHDDRIGYFGNKKAGRKTVRLALFHLLMARCQAVQCILNTLECEPQTQQVKLSIYINYSRICRFARESRKIAEGLESEALQARSEYWAGRGSGGLRDWQAAIMHFTNAIRLDVPQASSKHTKSHFRGLFLHEMDDVEFLLQSVTRRFDEWKRHRKERLRKSQYVSDSEYLNWEDLKDPLWTPHLDFKKYAAKQKLETNKKAGRPMIVLLTKEGDKARTFRKKEVEMIRKRLTDFDDKSILRRTLNANEWCYILRGDGNTKRNNRTTGEEGKCETKDLEDEIDATLPSLTTSFSLVQQPSLERPRNLGHELEQSSFDGNFESMESTYDDGDTSASV